ncbi:Os07g0578833 [Oryza sativa Japonica Group]|uniref:Os07g0578833 protein n=2 Tax=Oryza sativa subsp. japonica TaxID=39947 RepID=Q8LI17_ORYSJ|nr:hypothetical protein DAI22_07g204601 [Oryza sativa Japonica Group]BAC07089.1 hypothetical protein [Oryza sativa Japonica Group]BAT02319.1 Os07g0578833 [Oryza sativa Japonica Group]
MARWRPSLQATKPRPRLLQPPSRVDAESPPHTPTLAAAQPLPAACRLPACPAARRLAAAAPQPAARARRLCSSRAAPFQILPRRCTRRRSLGRRSARAAHAALPPSERRGPPGLGVVRG